MDTHCTGEKSPGVERLISRDGCFVNDMQMRNKMTCGNGPTEMFSPLPKVGKVGIYIFSG